MHAKPFISLVSVARGDYPIRPAGASSGTICADDVRETQYRRSSIDAGTNPCRVAAEDQSNMVAAREDIDALEGLV